MTISTALSSTDALWHPHASCSADGPDPYYQHRSRRLRCDTCPAAEPCLWAGLALEGTSGHRYGTWGGTSPARRDRIAASLPDDIDYTAWYLGVVADWSPANHPPVRRSVT